MIYTALDGSQRDGIVWSPGPVPRSVWLLPYSGASTAEAIAVRFDHLHDGPAVEVARPNDLDTYRAKSWHGEWIEHPRTPIDRQAHYLSTYRNAAPLPATAWRYAVALSDVQLSAFEVAA